MTQVTGAQRFLSKGAFRSRGRRSPAARLEIRLVSEAGLLSGRSEARRRLRACPDTVTRESRLTAQNGRHSLGEGGSLVRRDGDAPGGRLTEALTASLKSSWLTPREARRTFGDALTR